MRYKLMITITNAQCNFHDKNLEKCNSCNSEKTFFDIHRRSETINARGRGTEGMHTKSEITLFPAVEIISLNANIHLIFSTEFDQGRRNVPQETNTFIERPISGFDAIGFKALP